MSEEVEEKEQDVSEEEVVNQEQAESDSSNEEDLMESSLDSLEEEIKKLEHDLAEDFEEELDKVENRLSGLKEGLNVAQEIERQISKLEEELVAEREEKEKYISRLQRLQADFSNYKKRVDKEKERISTQATKDFVADLLPVIDNFERALGSSEDSKEAADVLEGVDMIHRQLIKLLHKNDVEEIETVGEEFDPNFHEAVMNEPSEEYDSGIITEELQKGYKLGNQVIRAAMVKLAESRVSYS